MNSFHFLNKTISTIHGYITIMLFRFFSFRMFGQYELLLKHPYFSVKIWHDLCIEKSMA